VVPLPELVTRRIRWFRVSAMNRTLPLSATLRGLSRLEPPSYPLIVPDELTRRTWSLSVSAMYR
jgi:hypothetical protein